MERVERLRRDYDVSIEGKAFLLRPDTPKEGRPREPRPGESPDRLGEPLAAEAEQSGLIMRPPSIVPNTMYALQATEYAKRRGAFDPFHHGLYRAYWENGDDLGDLGVIRRVAEEAGLDWLDMADQLDAGSYEKPVMDQFQEAVNMGIRGIPAFLMGRYMFTGARPYEDFRATMDRVLLERAGEGSS